MLVKIEQHDLKDDKRTGRPKKVTKGKRRRIIREILQTRISLRQLAAAHNLSKDTIRRVIKSDFPNDPIIAYKRKRIPRLLSLKILFGILFVAKNKTYGKLNYCSHWKNKINIQRTTFVHEKPFELGCVPNQ